MVVLLLCQMLIAHTEFRKAVEKSISATIVQLTYLMASKSSKASTSSKDTRVEVQPHAASAAEDCTARASCALPHLSFM